MTARTHLAATRARKYAAVYRAAKQDKVSAATVQCPRVTCYGALFSVEPQSRLQRSCLEREQRVLRKCDRCGDEYAVRIINGEVVWD